MGGKLGAALGDVAKERSQVLEIKKQKTFVIGQLEGGIEDAFLGGVEVEHAREEQRSHLGNRSADRVALAAEQVPEDGGEALEGVVGKADFFGACGEEVLGLAWLGQSCHIALDIGAEYGDPSAGEPFGKYLESNGFSRSGGARDETVAVAETEVEVLRPGAGSEINGVVDKHGRGPIQQQDSIYSGVKARTARIHYCA